MNDEAPVRILLVEDDVDDAQLLQRELERRGMKPIVARVDTEHAYLKALASGEWDVILSDYAMPTFDGMKAFRIAREGHPHVPFIFVSGALGEDRAVEAMRAGARDYIVKGAHHSRVCEAIRREMAVSEAERHREAVVREAEHQRELRQMAVEATGASVLELTCDLHGGLQACWSWKGAAYVALSDEGTSVRTWDDARAWVSRVIHPDDHELLFAAAATLSRGALSSDTTVRACDVRGDYCDLQVYLRVAARNEAGVATRVVAVVLDVTERRNLEGQFRRAQKLEAVGRLAGGVAHDFNNLLTVILGLAQLLGEELPAGSSARDDVDEIAKAARRASALTQQLLAFARLRASSPRVVSAATAIRSAERMLLRLLPATIELCRDISDEVWSVQIDPVGLEQVLMNLVLNARDAMPNGGRIELSVRNVRFDRPVAAETTVLPGDYVDIAVADQGEGMDAAVRGRIFEPFFTTKTAGKGTGLGLAVCHGIVGQAGGHLLVESELHRGTTVRVLLPRCLAPPDDDARDEEDKELRGTERVVVVEHDDQVRALVLRTLSDFGYLARGAASGGQAALLLADGAMPVELVVCDASSRAAGVAELLEHVASRARRPRTLLLSSTGNEVLLDAVDGERSAVLHKPFGVRSFAGAVRALLDRA